jgi:uncharacterized protein (DUF4415 family)
MMCIMVARQFTWHEPKGRTTLNKPTEMNNSYSLATSDERDEYPKVTQADLDRATFRVGFKPAPRKRRVTILLDTGLVEYFKAQAGERGYQTLINETLRQAVERDDLEERLRRIIREEIRSECARAGA